MMGTQTRVGAIVPDLVPSSEELRQNLETLAHSLMARAASLEAHHTNKHSGIKLHLLWQAMGKQQQLRAVARHLR